MSQRPFTQVDVFASRARSGNPVAVVLNGEGLSDHVMQDFARWTHLSETTFVLPPSPEARAQGADYRLRIFTPVQELPFAGHPTLGSAHAWVQAHGETKPTVIQECAAGLISVRIDGQRLAFAAPPRLRSGPLPETQVDEIAKALGVARDDIVAHAWCDNGPPWRGVLLKDVTMLRNASPHPELEFVGLVALTPEGETDVEVRTFFPGQRGMAEDPVTGSFNAALAQWLIEADLLPGDYIARQGLALGCDGRVHISRDDTGQIWVGGDCLSIVSGQVDL